MHTTTTTERNRQYRRANGYVRTYAVTGNEGTRLVSAADRTDAVRQGRAKGLTGPLTVTVTRY